MLLDALKNPLSIVVFLLLITILVAAHEYGHYLFARLFKMGVEEFSIGFGSPKWVWKRKSFTVDGTNGAHETEFTFRPIPLGGFVRIAGMQILEDGAETRVENGFYSKTPFARWMVLFAGPLFSVIAGIAILTPLFMARGVQKPNLKPILGNVGKDMPAAKAGLQPDDVVLSIDGKPIDKFFDIVVASRENADKPLKIEYRRKGATYTTVMTPIASPQPSPVIGEDLEITSEMKIQGKVGIAPRVDTVRQSFGGALYESVTIPFKMLKGLIGLAKAPQRFSEEMGGPLMIVAATGFAVDSGVAQVLELAGALSISLGLLNLIMPFPPFDGGQMVIAALEGLRRGRRLSYKVQESLFGVGIVTMLIMAIAVTWSDIKRFATGPSKPAVTAPKEPTGTPKPGDATTKPK